MKCPILYPDLDGLIPLLVGPAGAGKTRTLRAVVDAWEQGPVCQAEVRHLV